MRFAVVGQGAWGKRISETLAILWPEHQVDTYGREFYPDAHKADAYFIATPAHSHALLVEVLIKQNLPVFCEKPFVTSVDDFVRIAALVNDKARHYSAPILVNHMQLWSPAYEMAKTLAAGIGKALFAEAMVVGDKLRLDCSPFWDYGVHEVAMLCDLGLAEADSPVRTTSLVDGANWSATSFVGAARCSWKIDPTPGKQLREMSIEAGATNMTMENIPSKDHIVLNLIQPRGAAPVLRAFWSSPGMMHERLGVIGQWAWPKAEDQPLARALKTFIDALGGKSDPRLGLKMAARVTDIVSKLHRVEVPAPSTP